LNKEISVNGKVVTGSKQGRRFVNLPWVKKQILNELGFEPYIGTLNLKILNKEDISELRDSKGITVNPEVGYFKGELFKALIMKKIKGVIVVPIVPSYPLDLLEIIAPINLRETLKLRDGMTVNVKIKLE